MPDIVAISVSEETFTPPFDISLNSASQFQSIEATCVPELLLNSSVLSVSVPVHHWNTIAHCIDVVSIWESLLYAHCKSIDHDEALELAEAQNFQADINFACEESDKSVAFHLTINQHLKGIVIRAGFCSNTSVVIDDSASDMLVYIACQ